MRIKIEKTNWKQQWLLFNTEKEFFTIQHAFIKNIFSANDVLMRPDVENL